MDAKDLTPRVLFDPRVQYQIPPFQRPYVWDRERQWEPLWEDIARIAELRVDDPDNKAQHFLGAVVYKLKGAKSGDVTRHEVIDGQQRTTTLQLVLDAVQQVFVERDHELYAEDLEALIVNRGSTFAGKPERFKLWPSRLDRDAFSQAMDPQPGWSGDHKILEAHEFFRSEAAAWLTGIADADGAGPPGTESERARALCEALSNGLVLVAIDLTGHDDAQVIFETLNDRGTPLLKADLIKNWVFQRGEDLGADIDKWAETHWVDFDDEWWRAQITQGRHSRSRIDIFLQYWLTMRVRDEVKTDNVFREFSAYANPLMSDLSAADELLQHMRRDADTYRQLAQLPDDTVEGAFHSRVIETMELAATTPVLLWLLSDNHDVPDDQVEVALRSLESWVMRRTVLRYTMKDVNKLMVSLLKHLDDVDVSVVGTAVRDFLSNQTADARVWPTDAQIVEQLPKSALYGNIRQPRIRVVLEAVELLRRSRSEKHEAVTLPSGMELEHIMPRGWRTHWDRDPKMTDEEAAARSARLNVLGNLTLVSKKLNISLSNRPWTDDQARGLKDGGDVGLGKRSLLKKYSILILSRDLVDDNKYEWSEEDIDARSLEIARDFCEIWQGPPVVSAEVEAPERTTDLGV